jgi:hypothetical protein
VTPVPGPRPSSSRQDLAATRRLQIKLLFAYVAVGVVGLVLMALDLRFCRTPAWYASFTVVEVALLFGVVALGFRRKRLSGRSAEG